MFKNIRNRISFNKLVKNYDNKKYINIIAFIFILVVILSLFYFIGKTSIFSGIDSSVKKDFKEWVLLDEYTVDKAIDKSLKKVKWKYDKSLDVIIISGLDKSSDDKIVMTFTNDDKATFKSMTRNGEDISYSDWYSYLISYKD